MEAEQSDVCEARRCRRVRNDREVARHCVSRRFVSAVFSVKTRRRLAKAARAEVAADTSVGIKRSWPKVSAILAFLSASPKPFVLGLQYIVTSSSFQILFPSNSYRFWEDTKRFLWPGPKHVSGSGQEILFWASFEVAATPSGTPQQKGRPTKASAHKTTVYLLQWVLFNLSVVRIHESPVWGCLGEFVVFPHNFVWGSCF